MSALCLSIPLHGERVPVNIDKSIVEISFLFDLDNALFEKIENTLQLYFPQNASTLVLENFYSIYDEAAYPTFIFQSQKVNSLDIINKKIGTYIEYGKSYYEIDEALAPNEMLTSNTNNTCEIYKQQLDFTAFANSSFMKASQSGDDAIIKVGESEEICQEITLKNLGKHVSTIEKELASQSFKGIIQI